jgi:hypothetical protein
MSNIRALEDRVRQRPGAASGVSSFQSVGSFTGPLFTLSGHGDPEHIDGETVSRGCFQALRVNPVAGRIFSAEESSVAGTQPVAIIGTRAALLLAAIGVYGVLSYSVSSRMREMACALRLAPARHE